MIQEISLQNFQSHPDTELKLHQGINSIIGSSDSGKSAILRALYWIINNRPSGDNFISYWAKDNKGKIKDTTEVKVFSGGKSASRFKSPEANGYSVDNATLEAIRTDVPEQIQSFFNLSEVNIQKQLDAPFLISESAGSIARFFNSIIKLDSIDVALVSIEKKKRNNKADLKQAEELLEEAEKHIEEFDWIPEAEDLLNKAEKYNISIESKRKEQENIKNQLISLESQLEIIENSKKILSAESFIDELTEIENDILQKNKELNEVLGSISSYEEQTNRIQEHSQLSKIADEGLLEKAESLDVKITDRINDSAVLKISMIKYIELSEKITDSESIIEQVQSELPDVCPTCGRPMEK